MQIKFFLLAALIAIVSFQGCIPSIHPLYTEDTIVFVEDLLGIWQDPDNVMTMDEKKLEITMKQDGSDQMETWSFEKGPDKSYNLIHVDAEGKGAVFEVFVVKLGEHLFLDFYPSTPSAEEKNKYNIPSSDPGLNGLEAFHYLPAHTFAKLEITDTHLKISMFDSDFLSKLFEQNRIRIKHEKQNGNYILTASSEELQKFVAKYADDEEAFIEPTVLKRRI